MTAFLRFIRALSISGYKETTMQDLHQLPKLRDSLSYLYVEHAVLNQKDKAIETIRKELEFRVQLGLNFIGH